MDVARKVTILARCAPSCLLLFPVAMHITRRLGDRLMVGLNHRCEGGAAAERQETAEAPAHGWRTGENRLRLDSG